MKTVLRKNILMALLIGYTTHCFAQDLSPDALNDTLPVQTLDSVISSSNGVIGLILAYHVWDWNCSWQFSEQFHVSGSINNLTNEKYFNRRITMYPGPGILPADGRTVTISLGLDI
jgi:outer membrane receptor for Fe3+-dicitrate